MAMRVHKEFEKAFNEATKEQVDQFAQAEERKEYQRAKAERYGAMYGERKAMEAQGFGPGGLYIAYDEFSKINKRRWFDGKTTRKQRRLAAQLKRQRK